MLKTKPFKIVILTDSAGKPRPFPLSEIVQVEETFPYLLRNSFPNAIFYQLSIGGAKSSFLLNQTIGYLNHWDPDLIIVQAGMNDSWPHFISKFHENVISRLTGRFSKNIIKKLNDPSLLKYRRVYPVRQADFRKSIRQFQLVFSTSKIFWIGIGIMESTENDIPELKEAFTIYNNIIKDVYNGGYIPIQQILRDGDGFNKMDGMHWNKKGHAIVADILLKKVNEYFPTID